MLDMGETFLVYVVADLQDRPCRDHGAAALTIDEFNPAHFPEPPWWNPEAPPALAAPSCPWQLRNWMIFLDPALYHAFPA
jgi:hypothetical protein